MAHGLPPAARDGLLVPEIFSPAAAAALPALFAAASGPRAALFYDAVALKFPEMTPPKIVARYPAYLRELLAFDGIAAISADARDTLLDYWRWLGVKDHPEVVAITLGVDGGARKLGGRPSFPRQSRGTAGDRQDDDQVVVLSVGSLEGRKNHGALLEACERLWAGGGRFELRLIGPARPETGRAAWERLRALQAAGRPLRYDGVVDDAALDAAYATCSFTVYPSLMEGFGLPVSESLVRGKPCVCSGRGALGESARGGGCLALEAVDATSLAGAIGHLLADQPALERLSAEARARKFKSVADYAREVEDWMHTLSRGSGK
jgi:glycosyltransferase involved in cell wall biosynthesis